MSQLLNKLTNLVVGKITDENLIQNNYMEIEENTLYRDIDYNFKLCLHFHNASDAVDPYNNYLLYITDGSDKEYIRPFSNNFNICFHYMQQVMSNDSINVIIYTNDSSNNTIFDFSCLMNQDNNNKMIFELSNAKDYCTSISNNLDLQWNDGINHYSGYVLNEDVDEFHIHFYFDTQNPKGS